MLPVWSSVLFSRNCSAEFTHIKYKITSNSNGNDKPAMNNTQHIHEQKSVLRSVVVWILARTRHCRRRRRNFCFSIFLPPNRLIFHVLYWRSVAFSLSPHHSHTHCTPVSIYNPTLLLISVFISIFSIPSYYSGYFALPSANISLYLIHAAKWARIKGNPYQRNEIKHICGERYNISFVVFFFSFFHNLCEYLMGEFEAFSLHRLIFS